ncbi:MAG: glycosyltransferase [Actinomycetes bacterium]
MSDADQPGHVAFLVPEDVDAPTGGNVYDRRIAAGLADLGWDVDLVRVRTGWAADAAEANLDAALARLPEHAVAVVDGLVGHPYPAVLAGHADRLSLVSVVHLLLADEYGVEASEAARLRACERESLAAVAGVVVTSPASRRRLVESGMNAGTVWVVEPGTDPAPTAHGTDGVHQWLCPAAVTRHKDQRTLLQALTLLPDIPWQVRCVGPIDRNPAHAAELVSQARQVGLGDRFVLVGPRTGHALAEEYDRADLVVLPSRFETYGMVLAEALARRIPVVSTTGGGIPDTVGRGCGLLVPPGDAEALAEALRRWATDPTLRRDLRAAVRSRPAAPTWSEQAWRFAETIATLPDRQPTEGGTVSAVSPSWLALREPADHEARTAVERLLPLLRAALGSARPIRVVDVGAGTGSNLRWVAPRLPGPQEWVLVDRDRELLARALDLSRGVRDGDGFPVRVGIVDGDLRQPETLPLCRGGLLTASALLDVLSPATVQGLVQAAVDAGTSLLFSLTVDGDVELDPADPLDHDITAAFAAHQRRLHGEGPFCGADGTAIAADALHAAGYVVHCAKTPWTLEAGRDGVLSAWLDEWVAAALEQEPSLAPEVRRWRSQRGAELAGGRLRVRVGHEELLGLPGGDEGAGVAVSYG